MHGAQPLLLTPKGQRRQTCLGISDGRTTLPLPPAGAEGQLTRWVANRAGGSRGRTAPAVARVQRPPVGCVTGRVEGRIAAMFVIVASWRLAVGRRC